jgi:ABC-type dipeptide/oligopeptide/nickel transport system permease subunit
MISVLEITNLIKEGVGGNIYPLRFPKQSNDASSIVNVTSSSPINGGVGDVFVQVTTRDNHPAKAEQKANEIRSLLEKRTDFFIGKVQVVFIQSQNTIPLYLGTDENGRDLFSVNYKFILGV